MSPVEKEILQNILMMAESLEMQPDEVTLAKHVGESIRDDVVETIRQMQEDYSMSYKQSCAVLILALSAETMGLVAAREMEEDGM